MTQPIGIFLLAIFFALSACILVGAGLVLLWPGTPLDAIWVLNPSRRALLEPYAALAGPGFLLLAVAMAAASAGCFMRRKWGWWLAVIIFVANGLGDLIQLFIGHVFEGTIGVAVAAALIFYLTRPRIRAAFR